MHDVGSSCLCSPRVGTVSSLRFRLAVLQVHKDTTLNPPTLLTPPSASSPLLALALCVLYVPSPQTSVSDLTYPPTKVSESADRGGMDAGQESWGLILSYIPDPPPAISPTSPNPTQPNPQRCEWLLK